MVNEIKKNSKVILNYLLTEDNVTISEMDRGLSLSRGQIRIALAYLLGSKDIIQTKIGMAKMYNLPKFKMNWEQK